MKISILGNGVFGSVVANHLKNLNHEVFINKVEDTEIIFVCVPSFVVVQVLLDNKSFIANQKIIICSKGFNNDGRLLSEALRDDFVDKNIFFFYGPTIAEELERGVFSGIVLAGGDGKELIKKEIESDNLRIELSDDIIGVQVGAAMKNVITIFVGISEGAGYGENTQAYVLTKGIREIQMLGVKLGADPLTFMGLTCLGDLSIRSSRNRLIGVSIGKGRKFSDIIAEMKNTQEGLTTIKNFRIISKKAGVELPFVNILYSIIYDNLSIEDGIRKII